jgi:hypothetical protein
VAWTSVVIACSRSCGCHRVSRYTTVQYLRFGSRLQVCGCPKMISVVRLLRAGAGEFACGACLLVRGWCRLGQSKFLRVCRGVWSGVMAKPNRSSRGVRRTDGRMRSLSWRIASSKCLGHEYGMVAVSIGVSESLVRPCQGNISIGGG